MNQQTSFPISPDLSWNVIDSTKIAAFCACPRKFFYEYLRGWRPEAESHHLLFGSWIHEAMEYLLLNGNSLANAEAAYELFMGLWTGHYGFDLDISDLERFQPKTPENVLRMLKLYVTRYGKESFHVKRTSDGAWTEIGGKVLVGLEPERELHFRLDAVLETPSGTCWMDHKTSKYGFSNASADQWNMRSQFFLYQHVVQCYCGADDKQVYGVVNEICLRNAPKNKLNGEPYANQKDCEFNRQIVKHSPVAMLGWLGNLNRKIERLEEEMTILSEETDSQQTMKSFHTQEEACSSYSGCPYRTICLSYPNPLQIKGCPAGFKVEFWNPATEPTKINVNNLTK